MYGRVRERERQAKTEMRRGRIHRKGERKRETETDGWKAERRIWKGEGYRARESYTA